MRPSDGRIHLWPAVVVVFLSILLTIGISSGVRLNAAPPPDFVALRVSSERADAAKASAYWELAVRVIQWKYNRVSGLPEQVPEDFKLPDATGKTTTSADRSAYWKKLREEWLRSENWHTTYGFDLSWLIRDVATLSHAVGNFVDHS